MKRDEVKKGMTVWTKVAGVLTKGTVAGRNEVNHTPTGKWDIELEGGRFVSRFPAQLHAKPPTPLAGL